MGGDPLHRLQGEVALPSLQPADVGAVHAEDFGEPLLRIAPLLAVSPEVPAQRPLQLAFHNLARCQTAT